MTQLEIIILSLLCEKDFYGYEIESIIELKHMREWTRIGFSSIYNTLNKLKKKGYINSYVEKKYGSPKRKVYAMNKDAKDVVRNEILKLLQSTESSDSDFSVGISFLHLFSKNEVLSALNKRLENLKERRQHILNRYIEQPEVQNEPQLKALFTRPVKLIDAEIEWLNEFIGEQ